MGRHWRHPVQKGITGDLKVNDIALPNTPVEVPVA